MSTTSRTLPELPNLDSGLSLLDAPEYRRTPLHTLVLDHALSNRGKIVWLDAGNLASTNPIAQLAPTSRVLERIQVARAFTAFQHHALVETATDGLAEPVALVVAPNFDEHYRADDLGAGEHDALLVRSLARLAGLSRRQDVPVLLTRLRADDFTEPLERASSDVIEVEPTKLGPRFQSDEFETLVYPDRDGFQTTLAYWRRILEARHPEQVETTSPREVTVRGPY